MDALEGNHLLAQGLAIAAASGVGKPADSMPVEAGNASSSSWVFPLLLSCLAGASTCFGAAVVFCFEPSKIRRSMAFSLSLAAAVMVTISVVSILPEVATGILVPADNSLPVALGSSSTERGALEANNSSSSQYDFFVVGFGNQRIVRTKVLLERLGSLCLGVFAYLVLAKLLHFLPEPENMYLFGGTAEEEGNDMEGNSYDLYLHANTNDGGDRLETATDWNSDRVRRRTTKRSHGSSSNNNNNTKTMDTTTNAKFHRGTSNETLSSSGTLVAIEHGTEDGSAGAYAYAPSSSFATKEQRKRSWRVALMLFASLLIHNFPEGLCVAASAKESPELGITVAIGIFIHNVPEGIAISVPCIAAKPDRPWLAFWLASFSGLAEPLGAVVALSMLGQTKLDLENVLAFVAGVMRTVAFWELYPEAWKANEEELRRKKNSSSSNNNNSNGTSRTPPEASGLRLLPQIILRTEYRPILWGTLVGTALMVVTELYLP